MTIDIAFLVYPDVTQLDLTAPFEVLRRVPGVRTRLVWKTRATVRSDSGLLLTPDASFEEVQSADVLVVPGGSGQIELMEDEDVLDWVARVGGNARFVTAVCVGSFLLGAAGLLRGYRATAHWASLELLAYYGATPATERVVVDRNRITGGGVTAGIDFGLVLAEQLASRDAAEAIQLAIEYDPAPPLSVGSPRTAPPELVSRVRQVFASRVERRREQGLAFEAGLAGQHFAR